MSELLRGDVKESNIICGDCLTVLRDLPSESVQCCVTSPPYWNLRDYQVEGQIGKEKTPAEYVAKMVEVFCEVRRVLRKDGTVWLNLGDSYAGSGHGYLPKPHGKQGTNHGTDWSYGEPPAIVPTGLKPKDLIGIPWRVALALQADGWWLRSDIIWAKPNPMPESVTDRPTRSHEYIFLLTKSARYYYDADAIRDAYAEATLPRMMGSVSDNNKYDQSESTLAQRMTRPRTNRQHKNLEDKGQQVHSMHVARARGDGEPEPNPLGANSKTVWNIATTGFKEAHFATFPEELARRCIAAGSKEGDTILDCFSGAATTGLVALKMRRKFVGIELNMEYCEIARRRLEPILDQGRLI